jgi:hypothetical protein
VLACWRCVLVWFWLLRIRRLVFVRSVCLIGARPRGVARVIAPRLSPPPPSLFSWPAPLAFYLTPAERGRRCKLSSNQKRPPQRGPRAVVSTLAPLWLLALVSASPAAATNPVCVSGWIRGGARPRAIKFDWLAVDWRSSRRQRRRRRLERPHISAPSRRSRSRCNTTSWLGSGIGPTDRRTQPLAHNRI